MTHLDSHSTPAVAAREQGRAARLSAVEHALLAVWDAQEGDCVTANGYISRTQQQTRATARRERQVVEIAALVVAGRRERAAGLAMEHTMEFPSDAELLARVSPTPLDSP